MERSAIALTTARATGLILGQRTKPRQAWRQFHRPQARPTATGAAAPRRGSTNYSLRRQDEVPGTATAPISRT